MDHLSLSVCRAFSPQWEDSLVAMLVQRPLLTEVPEADYEFDLSNTLTCAKFLSCTFKYWHAEGGFIFLAVASLVETIKLFPLLGYGVIFLVFGTLYPSLVPHLTAANSSWGPRSLLIPRASLNLPNLPLPNTPQPCSFPDLLESCFLFSPFSFSSGRTIQIRHSVCVDASSLQSLTCCTLSPRRRASCLYRMQIGD